jgi:hypothetical protein
MNRERNRKYLKSYLSSTSIIQVSNSLYLRPVTNPRQSYAKSEDKFWFWKALKDFLQYLYFSHNNIRWNTINYPSVALTASVPHHRNSSDEWIHSFFDCCNAAKFMLMNINASYETHERVLYLRSLLWSTVDASLKQIENKNSVEIFYQSSRDFSRNSSRGRTRKLIFCVRAVCVTIYLVDM